ncbi:MAG TPA: hypothetical protein VFR97_03665 [Capillimicrobium sp.]|nr:hypothetical protein [Capillimicrobium sp.]
MRLASFLPIALAGAALAAAPAHAAGPDTSFSGDGVVQIPQISSLGDVAATSDGGVVAVGTDLAVVKTLPDGTLDPSFGGGDGVGQPALPAHAPALITPAAIAVDAQGGILVAGYWNPDGRYRSVLARLNPNGTPDTSFVGRGWQEVSFEAVSGGSSLVEDIHPVSATSTMLTGQLWSGGHVYSGRAQVHRLYGVERAGAWSTGSGGWVLPYSAFDEAGHLIAVGQHDGDAAFARFDGSTWNLDPAFAHGSVDASGAGENDELNDLAAAPGGGIVAVGRATDAAGAVRGVLLRTSGDGSTRTATTLPAPAAGSFTPAALALHPDGGVTVTGSRGEAGDLRIVVESVTAQGALDTSRGGAIDVPVPGDRPATAFDAAVDGQGRILVAGSSRLANGGDVATIARVDVSRPPAPAPGGSDGDGEPAPTQPPATDDPAPAPSDPGHVAPVLDPALAPLARLERPNRRPGRRLRGTAEPGATRVEVAVLRRTKRGCRPVLDATGALGRRAADCAFTRWLPAEGTTRWRLTFTARLPRGRYVAAVRAVGAPGATLRTPAKADGSRIAFRVR